MSDRYRTVIRRRHVRHREIQVIALTLIAAAVLVIGFFLGQRAAYSGMGVDPAQYQALQQQADSWKVRERALLNEIDMQGTRQEVDRTALELVRKQQAQQQDELSQLREELGFYRDLMAPEQVSGGMSLRGVEIVARGKRRYRLRVVAQQEARRHPQLKGSIQLSLRGSQDGVPVIYGLSDLDESADKDTLPLRFRYFQAIESDMTLPVGFEPTAVDVVVRSTSPVTSEISQQFPWAVQEVFSNVGQ